VEGNTVRVRSILVALTSGEECASLRRIFSGTDWALRFAPAFLDVRAVLRASSYGVVICAANSRDGHCWRDVVSEVQRLPIPPQLIVADRLADEALWAEVLNLGCYDLLTTPFDREEVLRVVPRAWDFWKRELEHAAAGPKAPRPAEPEWQSSRGVLAAGGD
jgi:DNA-binding NtrC family response regulator